MKSKNKFYVVWAGINPGIYDNWADCELQIKGFNGASYKSFSSLNEAEIAFENKGKPNYTKLASNVNSQIIHDSISVDAACSGNPGLMEYQGVHTKTKERIFHQGPFIDGTNNIGEFLAIVHALAHIQKSNIKCDFIYTDSMTALSWIKRKKCNTKLIFNEQNQILNELITRAETWLLTHTYSTKILKWDTKSWGEIPADFGRK